MADIGREAFRFAGLANPLVFGPLALNTEVAYSLFPSEKPTQRVGTVISYLNKQPYEIYAGEEYGPQSLGSYLKLRQLNPSKFPLPAGFKAPQAKAPQAKTPKAQGTGDTGREGPATTNPDWNIPPGGPIQDPTTTGQTPQDTTAGGFGTEVRKAGSEPGFESLTDIFEKLTSAEFNERLTANQLKSFAVQTAITQALGAEKSRERYKREIELERIKQWTDLAKTTQQTNLLSQALLGQALIASQQPSANVADIIGKGMQAAQTSLGGFQLRT